MRMVYAIASLTLLLAAGGTSAAVDWPGAAPCDTTLQACIDAQPSGGTVLVATDDPVFGDLLIAKSFTLSYAPGFSPVVVGGIAVALFKWEDA